MSEGLKIIAIEPLKGCYQKHIKVLSRNTKYYLYNDYEIDENDNFNHTSTISDELYSADGETPKINISAIVGKNGSGKSTLIELLLMAINNLSFALKIHNEEIKTVALEPAAGLNVAVYFISNKMYKLTINRNHISIIDIQSENDNQIILNLLYDNKDSKITRDINIKPTGSYIDKEFNLENFFYTIGTNYSQYSLNSNDYGGWIDNIFHKNDSYQTPLVVNPYRDKGNIDINKENDLIKSRLLAYLLLGDPEHLKLTEKQTAQNAIFKLNSNKYKNAYTIEVFSPKYKKTDISFEQFFKKNDKQTILNSIYSVFKLKNVSTYYQAQLDLYIIRKLISIARTYQKYHDY
jgi:ABC-type cobalamin/Fe3+-siderophores transport system ATPase subunit